MLAIQAITDAEGASDPPKLSAEDRKWGLHVGDVVQIVQGRSQECTYALYSGQGRVIHAWTPSRQNFRVRMDSLRALTASGYEVRTCSSVLDEFFCQLLKATPLEPASTIRRAKSALHVPAASRQSNLSLVLFARYGDTIFELLHSLKEAYRSACDGCQRGKPSHEHSGGPRICQSLLDSPAHLIKRDIGNVHNNRAAASAGPAIKAFLGSSGDFLMSEWLGKLLTDYFRDAYLTSNWYWVAMSPSTNWLTSVFLQYDIPEAIFRVRCKAACGLPERLAGDRMECGICWRNFTPLRVMLLKCQHYICSPCLRLLPRKECPYCRGPTEFAQPVSEPIKREALRLMMEAMELEEKPPAPILETEPPAVPTSLYQGRRRSQPKRPIHDAPS